ncbi:type IV pilus twitching motility protein PilT [Dehalobacterium formicoaceticum]|uniref:Type IV pilus twitching motility protein PilT n=1 Tax=Dehalobacterium formicoaceticum TaxID=51515 RepID=A0ABT1Y866_9FIRM|nr:type IV pilus twitching motility protein PilT [Dehalobacterium formicoaceticum]MCR6546758.1 type IV pilus twitching motility protein PilT [Dehalobacterium formicoaceticum]
MNISEILTKAVEMKASDVHLTAGRPPLFRLLGDLHAQEQWKMLLPPDTEALCREMFTPRLSDEMDGQGQVDFAYGLAGLGRFRVNVFKQRNSFCAAIRVINPEIVSLEELNLPPVVGELARRPRGMVLVTGPTGSGKSTTLASMIDLVNIEYKKHILTLEDPIEFLHKHKNCIVNQREIGTDTHSFSDGLRAGLREDPDVILVGEMRDPETISIAVTAAETGHLVLTTLHTSSAAQTVERIIDVFPPHQQQQIRVQLASTIQGVISQTLLKRVDGKGRIAAAEILIGTPAVRNLIREGKTHQLNSMIQTGGQYGMQSLDSTLRKMIHEGRILMKEALTQNANFQAQSI